MIEKIKEILYDIFEVDNIDETTSFKELGADYQDMQEILLCIEEEFDISVNYSDIMKIKNVKDLIEYIILKKDTNAGT